MPKPESRSRLTPARVNHDSIQASNERRRSQSLYTAGGIPSEHATTRTAEVRAVTSKIQRSGSTRTECERLGARSKGQGLTAEGKCQSDEGIRRGKEKVFQILCKAIEQNTISYNMQGITLVFFFPDSWVHPLLITFYLIVSV